MLLYSKPKITLQAQVEGEITVVPRTVLVVMGVCCSVSLDYYAKKKKRITGLDNVLHEH